MNLFLKILKWLCIIFNCLFFLVLTILGLIVIVIYTSINENSDTSYYIYLFDILILVIPIIIYFLLNLIFYIFKNKIIRIISAICMLVTAVLSAFCYLICITLLFLTIAASISIPAIFTIDEYDFIIKDIKSRAERTNNLFPTSYPLKIISDLKYYVYSEDDTSIRSLYFKTNKNYIDDIINKQKNNIIKTITWKDIKENRNLLLSEYLFDFKETGTFYLLKNKANVKNIAIIGTTKDNEILFYFSENFSNNNNTIEDYNK